MGSERDHSVSDKLFGTVFLAGLCAVGATALFAAYKIAVHENEMDRRILVQRNDPIGIYMEQFK